MKHIFHQGSDARGPVLLLLHGTGGTEQDLIPLASHIDRGASYLSVRGNVVENGMPRFFRRLAEGVFDEVDLIARTKELHEFLDQAANDYGFDRSQVIALGYSNGANIAGSLIFHYPHALRGAILHHPMVPRRGVTLPDLKGMPIFMGAGRNDMMCSAQESEELKAILQGAHAEVTLHWENAGHQLTSTEIAAAAAWYQEYFKK
ncbi:phospholipase/carboxylesterase [Paenibacillus shirakamiensis]|uniref:Phospholipase/carboxylesterase n=1 Tax=Paenibacillus shirakamiensis TaxID=1265935 RepID=A0ABS4JG99_9BACL|nr:alpha/beta hydrolase [Paenibacillus shirakamiensis]MBP2000737.1 phospholipase/carboxylesterase [Paenibacillus shirakamiensis]